MSLKNWREAGLCSGFCIKLFLIVGRRPRTNLDLGT
jgi:hypothetical protein